MERNTSQPVPNRQNNQELYFAVWLQILQKAGDTTLSFLESWSPRFYKQAKHHPFWSHFRKLGPDNEEEGYFWGQTIPTVCLYVKEWTW